MCHKGINSETTFVPFKVECTNCGSHNVNIIAFECGDLGIKCNKCGSNLNVNSYNELKYNN